MLPRSLLLTAIALTVFTPLSSTAITFSDGTFDDLDWTAAKVLSDPVPSFTAFQQTTGGNPGDFRRTEHLIPDETENIFVAHLLSTAVFDPSVSGAIATIDFSYDQVFLGGSAGTVQVGHRLIMEQGGTVFLGGPVNVANGPGDGAPGPWLSFNTIGLTSLDFSGVDFSSGGSAITFGYMTNNSSLSTVPLSTISGIDNWEVTVNLVPEPSTALLLGIGLVVLSARHRRP